MATWILRLTLLGGVAAQAAAPPGFDVASVKLVAFQRGTTSYRSDAGRIDYHQIRIKNLILKAYPLADYQIVWPAWVISQAAYYDVSATMSPATTQEQLQLMLQGLLADRFGLTSHWETRNTKVYAVEISPRGLKLRAAQNPPVNEDAMVVERDFSPLQRMWTLSDKRYNAPEGTPSGLTITRFLQDLNSLRFDRTIVNTTDLKGFYDIDLKIQLGDSPVDLGSEASRGGRGPATTTDPSPPELFDAMEKQLGLRVEAKTLPLRMLVIDHMERVPTGN